MERHKGLYKENSAMLTPHNRIGINRSRQNANRAKQRNDIFQKARNFVVSPTPQKNWQTQLEETDAKSTHVEAHSTEEKENHADGTTKEQNAVNPSKATSTRSAKAACTNAEKKSRQDEFVLRYIAFKEKKKREIQEKLENRKRPFIPVSGSSAISKASHEEKLRGKERTVGAAASFVPSGHSKFQPPEGLKTPVLENDCDTDKNKRKSSYMTIPTPTKKNAEKTQGSLKLSTNMGTKQIPSAATRLTSKPNVQPLINKKMSAGNGNERSSAIVTNYKERTIGAAASFVPSGHSKFQPPEGLKNPVLENDCDTDEKKLKSIHIAIPTPTKKNAEKTQFTLKLSTNMGTKQIPSAATRLTSKPNVQPLINKKISAVNNNERSSAIETNANGANSKKTVDRALSYPTVGGMNSAAAVSTAPKVPQAAKKVIAPPKKINTEKIGCANKGAVGKANKLRNKREVETARPATQKKSNLSVNLKAKKPSSVKSTNCATFKAVKAAAAVIKRPADIKIKNDFDTFGKDAETPSDIFNFNHFNAFVNVTSTNIKSLSPRHPKPQLIIPINQFELENKTQADAQAACKKKRNFNFIRYSTGQNLSAIEPLARSVTETSTANMKIPNDVEESTVISMETVVERTKPSQENGQQAEPLLSTPPTSNPHNDSDRPANYLSPFVTVSRGKVSAKIERERRNSVYLPSVSTTVVLEDPDKSINTENNVEVRRTLEAVRYFRLQLADEIERLHSLCTNWSDYKEQEIGDEDMINATIGQTKLLTSKKFQQFSGLIDRCELYARNMAAGKPQKDDGSEDTKLITAVDLEGFWSMLRLQVENVDKRFSNLERWKANNWIDPDEVPAEAKPKPKNKVKKSKPLAKTAKASSGLKEMLRKMHADMRQNKASTAEATIANVGLPSPTERLRLSNQSKGNNTPQFVSVVVRDRKSLSQAATVISIPASNPLAAAAAVRRSLTPLRSSDTDSPKSISASVKKFRRSVCKLEFVSERNKLLRAAVLNEKQKRLSGAADVVPKSPSSSVNVLGRKSILKTPGSVKGRPKSVYFKETLHVRKFDFTLGDEQSDEEIAFEKMKSNLDDKRTEQSFNNDEDSNQRTYQLRTRKVVLRPSSEFQIPGT